MIRSISYSLYLRIATPTPTYRGIKVTVSNNASQTPLTALILGLLLIASPRSASAQTSPTADYCLQNKLSTSVGTAPALTKIGPSSNTFTTATVDGASRTVLRFPEGNGAKISPTTGVIPNGTFTIVVLFELNDVGDAVSRFRTIIEISNGASDSGLYVEGGKVSFYRQGGPGSIQGPASFNANQYVQVVITRNAAGLVTVYLDGDQQFSFDDSTTRAAVISSENTLRFFRDDATEHSAGSVARIRLYDSPLDAGVIGRLDRIEPTVFTVNSTANGTDSLLQDGKCSTSVPQQCTLRAAVQQSDHTLCNDTINFAPSLSGGTINLTQGHISIGNEPDSLTINGPKPRPGARILTVSANNASRAFFCR